jgi:hypothetical protein
MSHGSKTSPIISADGNPEYFGAPAVGLTHVGLSLGNLIGEHAIHFDMSEINAVPRDLIVAGAFIVAHRIWKITH